MNRSWKGTIVACAAMAVLVVGDGFAQQPGQAPARIPGVEVDVVSTTPLPGLDQTKEQVAAPIQAATSKDLEESGALDLSSFLNRRLADIHINDIQGNPYQADVSYRGYTASPLLGTPQGLSVFMDGVRLNQPFGDVVSWDLIPRNAIASMSLMPGSNPLFGLNTLGGALSIQTKSGKTNPGGSAQVLYGSHQRRALEFEYGGSNPKGWNWFLAGNRFAENGWRPASHSDVRQMFGKFGRQGLKTNVNLTLAYANNSLNGNALQEKKLWERDYASVYTLPDNTLNRASFVNLSGTHSLSEKVLLSGNIYYRDIRSNTFNGDANDDALDQAVYQPSAAERTALANAGYTGVPASGATAANTSFPFWRCIGNVLLNDEPAEKCNGLINRTRSAQHNFGFAGQVSRFGGSAAYKNQFTAGAAFDRSRVGFRQSTQLGYLNPDRSISGLPAFADGGVTGGFVDGEPFDTRVKLDGVVRTWSLFGTNTYSPGTQWNFTVSGRYNRTTVHNSDLLTPGGGPGSLDGRHEFNRLNPAVGVTYSPNMRVNFYAGYSQGSRAATSIELGCADPAEPCKLPNAMAGDPSLKQVVSKTSEVGVRSAASGRLHWNAGYFHGENHNDILFVTSTQSGFGYFKNFGKTRRQGFDAALSGTVLERLTVGGSYTLLDATYRTAEEINGTGNSTSSEGNGLAGTIEIQPGDRLPLTPRHLLKTFVEVTATSRLSFDVDLVAASSSLARGNENGEHQPDGHYYLGPGRSAGYGVVDAGARLQLHPKLELVARLSNMLNKRYATAAQLGATAFTETGAFVARPFPAINGQFPLQQSTFFAPGAPRQFQVGTRVKF